MKIVTYNIQYTKGRDERFDLPRIVDELAGADIIGLQEVDRFWRRTGMQDQAMAIAELLPGFYWYFACGLDVAAFVPNADTAGPELRGRRRQHGNMLLSRWPILSARTLRLPRGEPDSWVQDRVLIEGIVDAPSGPLRVYVTHLCHISAATRVPQVRQIEQWWPMLSKDRGCWTGDHPQGDYWTEGEAPPPFPSDAVLIGDLNFEPADEEYTILQNGPTDLRDSWRVLGKDPHDPAEYTFEVMGAPEIRKHIDHIFVSSTLTQRLVTCGVDQQARGSDHLPVWIELSD